MKKCSILTIISLLCIECLFGCSKTLTRETMNNENDMSASVAGIELTTLQEIESSPTTAPEPKPVPIQTSKPIPKPIPELTPTPVPTPTPEATPTPTPIPAYKKWDVQDNPNDFVDMLSDKLTIFQNEAGDLANLMLDVIYSTTLEQQDTDFKFVISDNPEYLLIKESLMEWCYGVNQYPKYGVFNECKELFSVYKDLSFKTTSFILTFEKTNDLATIAELTTKYAETIREMFNDINAKFLSIRRGMLEPRENTIFRNTIWGDSPDIVMLYEDAAFISPNAGYDAEHNSLLYNSTIAGIECYVIYQFDPEQGLYSGGYMLTKESTTNSIYITDYKKLKESIIEKYGKPYEDEIITLNSAADYTDEGSALKYGFRAYRAKWKTESTEIMLGMLGNNFEIATTLNYKSIYINPTIDTSGF